MCLIIFAHHVVEADSVYTIVCSCDKLILLRGKMSEICRKKFAFSFPFLLLRSIPLFIYLFILFIYLIYQSIA